MSLTIRNLRVSNGSSSCCLTCSLTASSAPVAARFRSALMMDVSFPAISAVRIDDNNNTLMTTWEIEQRLSMIRVDVDRPLGDRPHAVTDDLWSRPDSTFLTLCAENKRESDMLSVTASALVPESEDIPQASATYEDTEVIRLAPGESISLTALVLCGTGREHVRYQRVSKVCLVPAERDNASAKYAPGGTPSETEFFCEFVAHDEDEARYTVLSAVSAMMADGVRTCVLDGR